MPTRNYANTAVPFVLDAAINASQTTLTWAYSVTPGAPGNGWPGAPQQAVIERGTSNEELVLCTFGSIAGSVATWTVTRGYGGTTAKTHPAGAKVEHITSAQDFRDFQAVRDHLIMRPGGAAPGMKRQGTTQSVIGNFAVLTVPAGKKAIVKSISYMNVSQVLQPVGLSISGTAWLMYGQAATPLLVEEQETLVVDLGLVLNPGEILNAWANSNNIYVTVNYVEVDVVDTPFRLWQTTLVSAAGYNTVYTAPAGGSGVIITHQIACNTTASSAFAAFRASGGGAGGSVEQRLEPYGFINSDMGLYLAPGESLLYAGVGSAGAISGIPA